MMATLISRVQALKQVRRENLVFGLFLLLLAIWNVPHTIALRYGLGAILLIFALSSRCFDWPAFRKRSWPLLGFFAYLLLYTFLLSDDTAKTLQNLNSEWVKFCLFAIVGWGVGRLLMGLTEENLLFWMAIACAMPILIHSGMSLGKIIQTGEIPSSFWGLHEHHADLGWAALSSTLISSVLVLWGQRTQRNLILFASLFTLSLASLLIAHSRAALVFNFIIVFLAFALWATIAKPVKRQPGISIFMLGTTLILSLVAIGFAQSSDENRWSNMQNRIDLGLAAPPLEVICKGLPYLKERLSEQGLTLSPEQEAELQFVNDGDGLRALLFRAGLELIPKHPLGINASKFPYQEAIAEECTPVIQAAHLHIGWLDTALSIGIPGALLYFFVLSAYVRQGLRTARNAGFTDLFALSLALTALIWILRALIDSTQRDQMLEMQICMLTFFSAYRLCLTSKPTA